jgi:hypothetical protein
MFWRRDEVKLQAFARPHPPTPSPNSRRGRKTSTFEGELASLCKGLLSSA